MPLDDDFQSNVLQAVDRLLKEEMVPLRKKIDELEEANKGYQALVVSWLQTELAKGLDPIEERLDVHASNLSSVAGMQGELAQDFAKLGAGLNAVEKSVDQAEQERVKQVEKNEKDVADLQTECAKLGAGLNAARDEVFKTVHALEDNFDGVKKAALLDAKEAALSIAQDHIKEPQVGPTGYLESVDAKVDGRKMVLSLVGKAGDKHEVAVDLPVMAWEGPYREDKTYAPDSVVSHKYAIWIACKNASGEPGNSPDWKLMTKAPRGKPGVSLKSIIQTGEHLYAKMTDGQEVLIELNQK